MFGKTIIFGLLVIAVTESYGASVNREGSLGGIEDVTRSLLQKLRTFVASHEKDYLANIDYTLSHLNNETAGAVTNGTESVNTTLKNQLKELEDIKQKADPKKAEECVKGQSEAITNVADGYLKNLTSCQIGASQNGSEISHNSTAKIKEYSHVVEDYSEQLVKCGKGFKATICLTALSAKISAQFGIYPVKSQAVLIKDRYEISKIESSVKNCVHYNEIQAEYKGKKIIEKVEACLQK